MGLTTRTMYLVINVVPKEFVQSNCEDLGLITVTVYLVINVVSTKGIRTSYSEFWPYLVYAVHVRNQLFDASRSTHTVTVRIS